MVRHHAGDSLHWRNAHYAQVSQQHGRRILHGRRRGHVAALLFALFDVSSVMMDAFLLWAMHAWLRQSFSLVLISLVSFYVSSYVGYGKDESTRGNSSKEEMLMSTFAFMQCVLLGSFAAILGAHRSEILDKNNANPLESVSVEDETYESGRYDPPSAEA